MKNITITLDDETAAEARVEAARQNMSLSRFVGETLQQHMQGSREYNESMQRFLALQPVKLKEPGERYPTREELYDRPRSR